MSIRSPIKLVYGGEASLGLVIKLADVSLLAHQLTLTDCCRYCMLLFLLLSHCHVACVSHAVFCEDCLWTDLLTLSNHLHHLHYMFILHISVNAYA